VLHLQSDAFIDIAVVKDEISPDFVGLLVVQEVQNDLYELRYSYLTAMSHDE